MSEIQTKIGELRAELYDVVNEVCNQMRLLRNEIVELQHAIYSMDPLRNRSLNNQGNSLGKEQEKSADKFFVQERFS